MASQKQPKPPKWQYSAAKKLLSNDILDGKTTSNTPKQVYEMHAVYKQYVYNNFRANLRCLKANLQELQDRADEDHAAFLHDEALNLRANNKPYPRWGGSVAEELLKNDIDNCRHETMKPHQLQATRPHYSRYPPKVFSGHLQQELRSRRERSYWLARRRQKETAKETRT